MFVTVDNTTNTFFSGNSKNVIKIKERRALNGDTLEGIINCYYIDTLICLHFDNACCYIFSTLCCINEICQRINTKHGQFNKPK